MTIIIRRPHAYKFAADHKGASIPGVAVFDAAGTLVANFNPGTDGEAKEFAAFLEAQGK